MRMSKDLSRTISGATAPSRFASLETPTDNVGAGNSWKSTSPSMTKSRPVAFRI